MSLYAVELKVTGTFSAYIEAGSQEDAQSIMKACARNLQPDSVVFDAIAYRQQRCELCGEEHFGPACAPRPVLLRPSWEREQL